MARLRGRGLFSAVVVFVFADFFFVKKKGIEELKTSMRKSRTETEIEKMWGEKGHTL